MNAKRVKRMCSVKGCHNTETYAISKIKEFGGVIICKSCLEEALKAVNNPSKQNEERGAHKKELPLFYHPEAIKKEDAPESQINHTEKDVDNTGRTVQQATTEKSVKTRTSAASKRK